jgi:nitroreductase
MLENANWAPTHGLTEPWRFSVFSGDGLKRLSNFQAELYREITPPDEFKQPKYDKLLQRPLLASHVISIGMKRQESGKIPEVEEIQAVACAVQNMFLTATAYGIAAYWTSGGITYEEKAKDFFGLGKNDKLLGFLFIGYSKESPKGRRNDMNEKVRWEK